MKTFTVNMINHVDIGIDEDAFLTAAREYLSLGDHGCDYLNNNLISAFGMLDWINESQPELESKNELVEGLKKLVQEDEALHIFVAV